METNVPQGGLSLIMIMGIAYGLDARWGYRMGILTNNVMRKVSGFKGRIFFMYIYSNKLMGGSLLWT